MIMKKWLELSEKVGNLSVRERAIIAGTVVVLVIFAWLQLYFTHYEKQMQTISTAKQNLLQDKVSQSQRLSELTLILENDPNKQLREEQNRLQQELGALKDEIEARMSNLIAPEKMADVMRQVLSDYKGLNLVSARNLPVEPLVLPNVSASQSDDEDDASQAVIFAHGFEMNLKGGYFQTVEFLQHLESMSGFYWRKLDYKVDAYPNAEITIQISTLSLEEDWIGV